MLARQRQALILDRVRESGAVRVADLARDLGRLGHDGPARPRDPPRARPPREGPRRRDADLGLRLVRAGVRRQVGAPAGREGRRSPRPPRRSSSPAWRSRSPPARRPMRWPRASRRSPGVTVVTNSLRVADVLYRSGRRDQTVILTGGVRTPSEALVGSFAVAPAPVGPPRPRVHGRARHGREGRLHLPEPARRRRRTGRSSRRAGGSSSSPTTASGASSGSHRSRGSTRRTSSSPTATWIRRRSSCSARPCASSSSSTWTTPRSSTSPRSRCRCGASPLRGRGRVPTDAPLAPARRDRRRPRAGAAPTLQRPDRRVGAGVRRPDRAAVARRRGAGAARGPPGVRPRLLPVPRQRPRQRGREPVLRRDLRVHERLRRAAPGHVRRPDRRRPVPGRGDPRARVASCASRRATT